MATRKKAETAKAYKVISFFHDLEDGNHPYYIGETYPREGLSPSPERVAELVGPNNKQRKPLIAEV